MLDQASLLGLPLPEGTATLTLAGDRKGVMLLGGGAVWRFDGKAWSQTGKLPLGEAVEGTVEDGKGRLWAWAGDTLAPVTGNGATTTLPGTVIAATAAGKDGLLFWLDGAEGLVSTRIGGRGKAGAGLPALPEGVVRPPWLITCGETILALSDDAFGFRMWRLDGEAWSATLEPGAGRYGMAPFVQQALSAGPSLAVIVSGPGKASSLNPAPPAGVEVMLARADGSDFDLLVGEPRMSPRGLKLPASLMGPGFTDVESETLAGEIVGIAISGRRLVLLEEAHPERSARLRVTAPGPDPSTWETFELETGSDGDRLRRGLVSARDGLYIAAAGGLFRLQF